MSVGRQQHQLRADHHPIGQRQARRPTLELTANLGVELDGCCHSSHAITFVNQSAPPSTRRNFRRGPLRRQGTVEPVFGQIKANRGANRFLRRGRSAVRSEWRLLAATHNLLKLHKHQLAAS